MADRTRTITLRVRDDFSNQLRRYARDMGEATEVTEDFSSAATGTRSSAENFFFMANAAQTLFSALSGVVSAADELSQLGVSTLQSKMALENYTGSAEEAATWINAIQEASRGAVTQGEAAAQAYQMMRFGLADTADAAGDFVEMVSIVAAASPQLTGIDDAISQISLTISNMSYARLDQLGISSGEVRARVAELKAEMGVGKEEAFRMAVFEELAEQADVLGVALIEVGDAQERMRTRFRGFKEDIAESAAIGFEAVIEGAEGAAAAIEKFGVVAFAKAASNEVLGTNFELFSEPTIGPGSGEAMQRSMQARQDAYQTMQMRGSVLQIGGRVGGMEGAANLPAKRRAVAQSQHNAEMLEGINLMRQLNDVEARREGMKDDLYTRERDVTRGQPAGGWNTSFSIDPSGVTGIDEYIQKLEEVEAAEERAALKKEQREQLYEREQTGGGYITSFTMEGVDDYIDRFDALATAENIGPEIAAMFQTIGGAVSDATSDLNDFAASAEEVSFDSLAEKFGTLEDSFSSDVLRSMRDALSEVGVESEAAAAAMEAYQQTTGLANTESAVFDQQMVNIAEQFSTGELSAAQYAEAVDQLSLTDFSGLNEAFSTVIDTQGLEVYMGMLDRMSTMDIDQLAGVTAMMADPFAAMADVMGMPGITERGGVVGEETVVGDEAVQIFDPEAAEEASNEVLNILQEGIPEIRAQLDTVTDVSSAMFDPMVGSAAASISEVEAQLDALSSRTWEVNVTVGLDQPVVVGAGGNGGQAPVVETTINVDGREIANATDQGNWRDNR